MGRVTFEQTLGSLSGDPREDLVRWAGYYGQFALPGDDAQHCFLNGGNLGHILDVDGQLRAFVKPSGRNFSNMQPCEVSEVSVAKVLESMPELKELYDRMNAGNYVKDFSLVDSLDKRMSGVAEAATIQGRFPTVELLFYLGPGWVLHDHHTVKLGYLCSNQAEERFQEIFGDDPRVMFMSFVEPGAPLGLEFHRMMKERDYEPKVVLLAQHGVVHLGKTPEGVEELSNYVIGKLRAHIDAYLKQHSSPFGVEAYQQSAPSLLERATMVLETLFPGKQIKSRPASEDDMIMRLVNSESALRTLEQGMLNPDGQVHGGVAPMVAYLGEEVQRQKLEDALYDAAEAYVRRWTTDPINVDRSVYRPKVVLIQGVGALTLGDTEKVADNAHAGLLDTAYVMRYAEAFGGAKPLSRGHQYYVNNWGQEHRRAGMVAK